MKIHRATISVEIELTDGTVIDGVMSGNLLRAEPWKGIEVKLRSHASGIHHTGVCILRQAIQRVEVIRVVGGERWRKRIT